MAKCKLLMSTAQVQKLIDFFDGYEDDKVKCKFIKKTGIKAEIECETELSPDEAASYCKGLFINLFVLLASYAVPQFKGYRCDVF